MQLTNQKWVNNAYNPQHNTGSRDRKNITEKKLIGTCSISDAQLGGKGEASPSFFENQKKSLDFRR